MSDAQKELQTLGEALTLAYGADQFPRELVGDLHDAGFTFEKGLSLLQPILDGSMRKPEELRRVLYQIEIMLEEDLPMIFRDVLASFQKIRELAGSNKQEG